MRTVYTEGARRTPLMWAPISSRYPRLVRTGRGATALEAALLLMLLTVVLLVQLPQAYMGPVKRLGDMLQNFILPRP